MAYDVASNEIGISRKIGVSHGFSVFFSGISDWFIALPPVRGYFRAVSLTNKVEKSRFLRPAQRPEPRGSGISFPSKYWPCAKWDFPRFNFPPRRKAQGGAGDGCDGYGVFDPRDIGSKPQQGSTPTGPFIGFSLSISMRWTVIPRYWH
jgi:hypothetical protein